MHISLDDMRTRVQRLYQARRLQLEAMPAWAKRALSILSRLIGLAILGWMAWATYTQWPVLASALRFEPAYLALVAVCYVAGFALIVASWHKLFQIFGINHSYLQDYSIYALMAAYRHLPVPYTQVASLMYYYKKIGVRYWTTGLSIVAQSVLQAIAGIVVAAVALCFDRVLQQVIPMPVAVLAVVVALVAAHPAVFGMILHARGAENRDHTPRIGWVTMLLLILVNAMSLVLGGIMLFACAGAVLDLPIALLPACIVVWGTVICVMNLLSWLPADFGIFQITFLALLAGHMSVAFITAMIAMFRASGLVLDLANAAITVAVRLKQKEGTTQ
jgi:hypothetical protein